MARRRGPLFRCQECGYQSPKWFGRCPACSSWGTMVEEIQEKTPPSKRRPPEASPITSVEAERYPRLKTGIGELDQVLGGGLVPASLVLIGGDPGIGKSTLVLQAAAALAQTGEKVLYVSGEESPEQIRLRAERVGALAKDLLILSETVLEAITAAAEDLSPALLIIDSIQTIRTEEVASAPGSVAQVRECTARLLDFIKARQMSLFIIGHVTKEGAIAGPRVLEHLVDTVLYFEGEGGHPYRILRAVKNRFGSTQEIGVFEMRETGLVPVTNPSWIFVSERPAGVSGSVVTACLEGTRPLLVEIQALVGTSPWGTPRRTAIGLDPYRVSLLVAILERRAGLRLYDRDIFINVVGGIRLAETAVDLAVALALASSHLDRPLPSDLLAFGEIGLAGELRRVGRAEDRLREAQKMGFRRALVPRGTSENLPDMEILTADSLKEALDLFF
ncbi:MAG TPA: DNA repair protein RadA [Thermodesulfatator sp.]|nr:DNA repair protein RadA [Thermodesulfatator sp.]